MLAIVLLAVPNAVPFPAPRSILSVAAALWMITVTAALAIRQLGLAWIAQDARYAIVGLGFAWFGVSAAVWFDGTPLTFGFWSAHLFDIVGVFAATVWGFITHRRNGSIADGILNKAGALSDEEFDIIRTHRQSVPKWFDSRRFSTTSPP